MNGWQSRVETQSFVAYSDLELETRKLLFRGGTAIYQGLQCRTTIMIGITMSQRVWINGRIH